MAEFILSQSKLSKITECAEVCLGSDKPCRNGSIRVWAGMVGIDLSGTGWDLGGMG